MLHYLHLNPEPFETIKIGEKTIEMRLYDEKRRKIKKGDVIEFQNRLNGEKIKAVVMNLYIFKSFEELYSKVDKAKLGYKKDDKASPNDMEQYYSKSDIEKYSVVGIEIKLLKDLTVANLVDAGICPTCFDRENNCCLYGNNKDKMLYENDKFECFLVAKPRAIGHIVISSKAHYKDMMEIPDDLCEEIFVFAKKTMKAIKKTYGSESVYLCTMCDGLMNHFHIQLIPRYDYEKRGSKNFVKERKDYIEDKEKIRQLRLILQK